MTWRGQPTSGSFGRLSSRSSKAQSFWRRITPLSTGGFFTAAAPVTAYPFRHCRFDALSRWPGALGTSVRPSCPMSAESLASLSTTTKPFRTPWPARGSFSRPTKRRRLKPWSSGEIRRRGHAPRPEHLYAARGAAVALEIRARLQPARSGATRQGRAYASLAREHRGTGPTRVRIGDAARQWIALPVPLALKVQSYGEGTTQKRVGAGRA